MDLKGVLAALGLLLNIVGIVLIFKFGLSPFVSTDGFVMLNSEKVINERNSNPNRKKRRYYRLALLGLLMCVLGDILQIISQYLSPNSL